MSDPSYVIRTRIFVDRALAEDELGELGDTAADCEERFAKVIEGFGNVTRFAVESSGPHEVPS